MTASRIARFYKEVAVAAEGGGYAVLLDGKPIRTPQKTQLLLPNEQFANAVASEWRAQSAKVDPAIMPVTRLANTALDGVAANREAVIAEIVGYGKTDAICYRADVPEELATLQARTWDPLLNWAESRFDAALICTRGLRFVKQPDEAVMALQNAVAKYDAFGLAALATAASICHSLVVALALAEGRLDPHQAYQAAHIEAEYQAGRWGHDEEATARASARESELNAASLVLESLRNFRTS